MKVYSIIAARGGSKGVPKKNIRLLGGYPLIAYSIIASQLSGGIQRVIVSTDSEEIVRIAVRYGAEVPFVRPAKFATDKASDLDVINHAIRWIEKNEQSLPDYLVQMRPTTPLRDPRIIDSAIIQLHKNPKATSLRSAHQLSEPPQKMFQIGRGRFWTGFFPEDKRPEYYNLPRQKFPSAYHPNGYVDIVQPVFIKKSGRLYGSKIVSFITPKVTEIDTLDNFEYLEDTIKKHGGRVYQYLLKNFKKEQ